MRKFGGNTDDRTIISSQQRRIRVMGFERVLFSISRNIYSLVRVHVWRTLKSEKEHVEC